MVDRLAGPGATPAELTLQFGVAFAAAAAAGSWYALTADGRWWIAAVAVFLGFDLGGGVVTNATATAKRWFHRDGQGFAEHMGFIAVHILHLAVIGFVVLPASRHYFLIASGILLGGAVIILLAPRPLTRPTALALFALVLVLHRAVLPIPPGFEWFTPVFFLKLFVSHLVPEGAPR
ncbi:MAG: hypothetical protein ACOCYG_08015 [Spirochaetota bacterium]